MENREIKQKVDYMREANENIGLVEMLCVLNLKVNFMVCDFEIEKR